jgi:hypothetical protein
MTIERSGDNSQSVECFLCGGAFQFGRHRQDGRSVHGWKLSVCNSCLDANDEGVAPASHPHLMRHLADAGVEVRFNDRGLVDIPR